MAHSTPTTVVAYLESLDMGKACLRFSAADELLWDAIAPILATPVDEFVRVCETSRARPPA